MIKISKIGFCQNEILSKTAFFDRLPTARSGHPGAAAESPGQEVRDHNRSFDFDPRLGRGTQVPRFGGTPNVGSFVLGEAID